MEFTIMDNEEYLNEKIKRATPHWTGVDTQEYINEIRGREMNEKQRITINENSWNDIIKLPCFKALYRYDASDVWVVRVNVQYIDGKPVRYDDEWYGSIAIVGDTLVEYDNGEWGLEQKHKED